MSLFTSKQAKTSLISPLNNNTFVVSLSDAEAQVIRHKAQKAGVNVKEYLRNAALGFPMG